MGPTEVPPLSREAERELLRRVRAKVRCWRGRVDENDYEDMLGEAYLRAWQSYCLGVRRGVVAPLDYALHFAAMGPLTWLRNWYGRRGVTVEERPSVVSWEAMGEETRALSDPRPGPEAAALAALETTAVWNWLRRSATPRQLQVLACFYAAGLNGEETARRLGVTPNAVWHCHDTALANSQVAPADLPSFFRPGTDYPRCRRGHYLTPENIGRGQACGRLSRCCLLCQRQKVRRGRKRGKRPTSPGAPQQTASGPAPLSGPGAGP